MGARRIARSTVAFVALVGIACWTAQPSLAQTKAAAAPTLKVGDKAPALVVEKWLKGRPVPRFERGRLYVVEFWATWCPSRA
jgi:thiol-disulfide isomerase/thioredoxin